MAKNLKSTGDAVIFAMFLIDFRIRYNKEAEVERLAHDVLETVPEDDSISLPSLPSTSIKSATVQFAEIHQVFLDTLFSNVLL